MFNIKDVDLFAMEVIFLHVKLFIKVNLSPPDFDFILYLHVDYQDQLTDISKPTTCVCYLGHQAMNRFTNQKGTCCKSTY